MEYIKIFKIETNALANRLVPKKTSKLSTIEELKFKPYEMYITQLGNRLPNRKGRETKQLPGSCFVSTHFLLVILLPNRVYLLKNRT